MAINHSDERTGSEGARYALLSGRSDDAAVIDAAASSKLADAATVIENRSTVIEEEKEPIESATRATTAPSVAAPATPAATRAAAQATTTTPAPARSRLLLAVAGLARLLFAGIVIYAVSVGFDTDSAATSANDAGVANRDTATASPAQTENDVGPLLQ